MKRFLVALLVAGSVAHALAAEDLLADLRAEVAAAKATVSLKSGTQAKGDGGPVYATHNLRLRGEGAGYELAYKSFLPPNEGRNQGELNDWAGGLGMVQPSDKGWYSNGFITMTLSDGKTSRSTADRLAQVRVVQESGSAAAGEFAWVLETGEVRARFFVLALRPELFLALTVKSPAAQSQLQVSLQCYPGGFVSPFDRWIHTAVQNVQAVDKGLTQVSLDPARESWLVLADHFAGVTPRPMGPCTVAVDPNGLTAVSVEVRDNYSVRPTFTFAPGQTTALFALREFPPRTWQDVVAEVSGNAEEGLAAARQALAALPQ